MSPAVRVAAILLSSLTLYGCQGAAEAAIPTQAPATAGPVLLIAHRGAVHVHPENTLPALAAAAELGADGIEFDVQRSADGSWWVMHDVTVDRTTGGTGRIGEMGDDEIRQLRIDGGAGYVADRDGRQMSVPMLSEVLDALSEYSGWLYIDLKEHAEEAHEALARYVEQRGIARQTTMLCQSEDAAAEVKSVAPSIRTLIETPGDQPPRRLPPHVDGWLGNAAVVIRDAPPLDVPYDVELFADLTIPLDERLILQPAYVEKVRALITNDVVTARRLLAEVGLD